MVGLHCGGWGVGGVCCGGGHVVGECVVKRGKREREKAIKIKMVLEM